jgi:hypothetical protein
MSTKTRRTPQQWQALVDDQATSHLSARQYCDQHQLSYQLFCKWRKQSNERAPSSLIDLSSLVGEPTNHAWDIELELGGGMALRLKRG